MESEQLKEVADRSELLKLHGLYKQAVYGDCEMGRPAMADIYGLAKWQHWKDLDGTEKLVAKERYIEMVERCLGKYKNEIANL